MHFRGIGTAHPPARYTKAECLAAFERSDWFARLDARSHLIARTVLQRDNGIEARRLALDSLDEVFTIDPDTLDRRFLAHAPALAAEAGDARARRAPASTPADDRRRRRQHLHRLPVSRAVRLRRRAARPARRRAGLRPGRPGLRRGVARTCSSAARCSAAGAAEHVLSVCVEVSSAAMYLDDDPGVLISACLFGDGAGAAVLSRDAAVDARAAHRVDRQRVADRAGASARR